MRLVRASKLGHAVARLASDVAQEISGAWRRIHRDHRILSASQWDPKHLKMSAEDVVDIIPTQKPSLPRMRTGQKYPSSR